MSSGSIKYGKDRVPLALEPLAVEVLFATARHVTMRVVNEIVNLRHVRHDHVRHDTKKRSFASLRASVASQDSGLALTHSLAD